MAIRPAPDRLLTVLDLAGTLVFAIEGAMIAIEANLDLLGIMVLSFATGLGGGMIRDVLIGAVPPAALRDWRYPVVAFAGGAIAFVGDGFVQEIPVQVIIGFDAAGLSLFAVAGTEKALDYGMQPLVAALLGGITGVGGGTARDVLLARVPAVLRVDVYATAALSGAVVMLAGRRLGLPPAAAAACGALFCFALRMVAVSHHWNLPKATAYHW